MLGERKDRSSKEEKVICEALMGYVELIEYKEWMTKNKRGKKERKMKRKKKKRKKGRRNQRKKKQGNNLEWFNIKNE